MFEAAKKCPKMNSRDGSVLLGLIHQHDGDVVYDGISPRTGSAVQTILLISQSDWSLACWADQQIKQLLRDRHKTILPSSAHRVVQLPPASCDVQVPSSVTTVKVSESTSATWLMGPCHGPSTFVQVSPASEL